MEEKFDADLTNIINLETRIFVLNLKSIIEGIFKENINIDYDEHEKYVKKFTKNIKSFILENLIKNYYFLNKNLKRKYCNCYFEDDNILNLKKQKHEKYLDPNEIPKDIWELIFNEINKDKKSSYKNFKNIRLVCKTFRIISINFWDQKIFSNDLSYYNEMITKTRLPVKNLEIIKSKSLEYFLKVPLSISKLETDFVFTDYNFIPNFIETLIIKNPINCYVNFCKIPYMIKNIILPEFDQYTFSEYIYPYINNYVINKFNITIKKNNYEEYLLIYLLELGEFLKVKELILLGMESNIKNKHNGQSLFYYCVKNNDINLFNLLIQNKNINFIEKGLYKKTPFCIAIENKNEFMYRELLKYGTDINSQNQWGQTPLINACINDDLKAIKFLLDIGADVNKKDYSLKNCFTYSISRNIEIIKLLIKKMDINEKNNRGENFLFLAIKIQKIHIVNLLLDSNININEKDYNGMTPLMLASFGGYYNMVELLINKGADITLYDNKGYGIINYACKSFNNDIVQLLINKGINIKKRNNKGICPFKYACLIKNKGCINIFLDKEDYNENLVLLSYELNSVELTEIIIERKIDITEKDKLGNTLIHNNCEYGNLDLIKLLLKNSNNVDINQKNNEGDTFLHISCLNEDLELFKLLLENGSNINERNNKDKNVLHYSCKLGSTDIIHFILSEKLLSINDLSKNKNSSLDIAYIYKKKKVFETFLYYKISIEELLSCFKNYSDHFDDISDFILEKIKENFEEIDSDNEIFLYACKTQNINLFNFLLKKKNIDINYKNLKFKNALYYACKNGNLNIVKILLKLEVSINQLYKSYLSVFIISCLSGNLMLVKFLIEEKNILINQNYKGNPTALHYVCKEGYDKIIKYLIKNGANINSRTIIDGMTPFLTSCKFNQPHSINILLSNGVNIYEKDNNEIDALNYACIGNSIPIVKILLSLNFDINKKNKTIYNPLLCACIFGSIDLIMFLILNGAQVNLIVDIEEKSFYKDWKNLSETLSEFIYKYKNKKIINFGISLLNIAVILQKIDIVELLINNNADKNQKFFGLFDSLEIAKLLENKQLINLLQK